MPSKIFSLKHWKRKKKTKQHQQQKWNQRLSVARIRLCVHEMSFSTNVKNVTAACVSFSRYWLVDSLYSVHSIGYLLLHLHFKGIKINLLKNLKKSMWILKMLRTIHSSLFPLLKTQIKCIKHVKLYSNVNSTRCYTTEFHTKTWSESLNEAQQKRIRHIQNEVKYGANLLQLCSLIHSNSIDWQWLS